ncbi:MAG: hypothetical protein H6732_13795 [Alphaproteobacteria bacterium]|nr:hypothetical protein [Alphaproteobacteria bacterium]
MRGIRGVVLLVVPWLLACMGVMGSVVASSPPVIDMGSDANPEEAAMALVRRCIELEESYDPAFVHCYAAEADLHVKMLDPYGGERLQSLKGKDLRTDVDGFVKHLEKIGARHTYKNMRTQPLGGWKVAVRMTSHDELRDQVHDVEILVDYLPGDSWRYVRVSSVQRL